MKRRAFIYNSILLASLPLFGSEVVKYSQKINITKEPYQTLTWVFNDLFPTNNNAPQIKNLNTIGYLKGVMNDTRVDESEKKLILNGVKWLHETTQEEYKKQYYSLDYIQRQKILKQISLKRWGDNWLWTLMKYMLESMFCDPIYGANINQAGWKWLEYYSGVPRPKKVVM